MALTRVKQDDNLNAWFTKLMNDVKALEYGQSQLAEVAGRKIRNIISALEDVERFEEIDTSLQIKQFLSETRDLLTQMVRRIVNVTSTVAGTLDTVSDFSYAWELMNDYVP